MVIGQLRQDLAKTIINDQIIKPLIDMNYEVTGGNYPTFHFREITEEHKHTVFKMWSQAVKDGVLIKTRDDENKARGMIEFEPLPDEEEPEDPDMPPEEEEDDDEIVVAEVVVDKKGKKAPVLFQVGRRPLSRFEKRVDFAAIERVFTNDLTEVDNTLRRLLGETMRSTIRRVQDLLRTPLTASRISPFSINVGQEVMDTLNDFLDQTWRKGRDGALKELPFKIRREIEDIKRFAGFEPLEALDFFEAQSLEIKGLIDADLTKKAKQELFEHLSGGRATTETIDELRKIFEPYIGDPEKIGPSGPGRPKAENLLLAHRLENIIRTPMTGALNEGRLAVGDAAGDFVIGYEYSAILDTRVTQEICAKLDGLKIRKDDPRLRKLKPVNHFQCRSLYIMITTEDLPVKFSTDAAIDAGVRRVPKGFR